MTMLPLEYIIIWLVLVTVDLYNIVEWHSFCPCQRQQEVKNIKGVIKIQPEPICRSAIVRVYPYIRSEAHSTVSKTGHVLQN